jgi:hypothetical protein
VSRVLYVEFDDEITELVERIRASGDEADLVFVLPNRARVLQSVLNLRLLQQYSRSFMKRTSIVSGDPRVQQLARDAAFPVYASVAAYDRGVQALPPLAGEEALPGPPVPSRPGGPPGPPPPPAGPAATAPPIGTDAAAALPVAEEVHPGAPGAGMATAVAPPPARPAPPRPRPTAPARPVPLAAVDALEPPVAMAGLRPPRSRRNLYMIAAAVFAVGLILLFIVAPSAKVTITLNAQPVSVDGMVIQGTPDPVAASAPDHILTQVVTDDVAAPFDAKPTKPMTINAAAAKSQIIFSSAYSVPFCLIINTNTVLASTGSIKFAAADQPKETCITQDSKGNAVAGVEVPASTNGQQGTPSEPIDVVATTSGAAGNVAAGAINQVDPAANGCNPANYPTPNPDGTGGPPKCSPSDFRVTNPAAATGGADQKSFLAVSDQDLAGFKSQVTQLTQQGTDKAKQEIPGKSGQPNFVYALDPANNGFGCTSAVNPPLPSSGDTYQETTITVTVHCTAVLYNPADVKQRVLTALVTKAQQAQAGATLLDSGRGIKDPQVQQSGADGRVVFNDSANGFIGPQVDPQSLKDSFAGKGKGTVNDIVAGKFPGEVQDVQVSQTIPWFTLPYFSGRIEVQVCVRTPQASC